MFNMFDNVNAYTDILNTTGNLNFIFVNIPVKYPINASINTYIIPDDIYSIKYAIK